MKLSAAFLFWAITFGIQAEETSRPGFQEGSNFGKANTGKVSAGVQNFNPKTVPGFVTDHPQETAYQTVDLIETEVKAATQSDMVQTLTQNYQNRPTDFVKKEDKWLQKGLGIEQSSTVTSELTGRYTDCKPTTPVGPPQYQLLSCDEFVGGEEKTCSIGQIVEVDAKHTYQCQSTRQREKLACQKILNIQFQENITQTPSCTSGTVIASAQGYRNLAASIRCQLDSAALQVDFICGWRGNPSTHTVVVNGSGGLNFSDCKLKRRSGDTLGVLPYSLICNARERCTLSVASLLSLSFDRPRTIQTVARTPVDVWDNQCAALEGRVR